MPNNETKKTESAPRKQNSPLLYIAISLILIVVLVGGFFILKNRFDTVVYKNVTFNNHTFHVEFANTQTAREQGLSQRDSIAANGGMLFDFGKNGDWRMWMVQMRFPIDIVWLKQDGTVVHVKENAQPADYPEVYKSDTPAWYVVELPSGTAQSIGIKEGSIATIQ